MVISMSVLLVEKDTPRATDLMRATSRSRLS